MNLLSFYAKHSKWLRLISIDLMEQLVSSPDLFVVQTEFSLYLLLRYWVFLKLFPQHEDENEKKQHHLKYFSTLDSKKNNQIFNLN